MRHSITRKVSLILALASTTLLLGCGSNNVVQQAGIPYTLPGGVGAGGCVPLSQSTISFTGTNVTFGGGTIVAGAVPRSQTVGTMAVTGMATTMVGSNYAYNRSGVDGVLALSATTSAGVGIYPYSTNTNTNGLTANVTGYVQLSSATLQDIQYQFGNTYNYNNTTTTYPYNNTTTTYPYNNTTTACVSGISIYGYYNSQGQFYSTYVYLYMNNSQSGYALYF